MTTNSPIDSSERKLLNDSELECVTGGQAVLPLLSQTEETPETAGAENKEYYVGMNKSELIDNTNN